MLVLALDTSTPACAVALVDLASGGPPVERSSRVVVDARRHGEVLAPSIAAVLDAGGCVPSDLGAIAVGLGPGPFTSLRVGIVTAATLGFVLGIPVHGTCSLDALAALVPLPETSDRFAVATDARRREVYWAAYEGGQRIEGPSVDRPAVAQEHLRDLGVTQLYGAGARLYADVFGDLVGTGGTGGSGGPDHPSAVALAGLVADRILRAEPPAPLAPAYLRRPDVAAVHPPKAVTA